MMIYNIIEDISVLLEDKTESLRGDLCTVLCHKGIEFDAERATIFQKPHITIPLKVSKVTFLGRSGFIG